MTIEGNCRDTRAARELHATVGELLRDEVPRLPTDRSRALFWQMMAASIEKNLPQKTAQTAHKKRPTPSRPETVDEALSLIADIEDMAESICEEGEDFAQSVLEKAQGIGETIERLSSVTDGQLQALENMAIGLRRWFHE